MSMTMPKPQQQLRISAGTHTELGATVMNNGTEDGVNFALYSENATGVEICLFDSTPPFKLQQCVDIPHTTDFVWHCHIAGLKPGQVYGFRVKGPYEPERGFRFNPNKIVLDPYAKSIARRVQWDDSLFGYTMGQDDLSFDDRDSSAFAVLGRVVKSDFKWGDTEQPKRPWNQSIIYETHVKGMSYTHPDIPESQRGTYLGMAHPSIVSYLKKLGITAIELLPVQHFTNDQFLVEKDLSNYWGYNTLAFFAPEPKYVDQQSQLSDIDQFKTMVKAFHDAGIEVIMDVVYNHSGEGNQCGPTLCYRGIDNGVYYRLGEDSRYYYDTTGCGNTFNVEHPAVLRMLMDSLRYWVTEMHIDGFRFDLASSLAREGGRFDTYSSFFKVIQQDPVLKSVKMIAEPWDLGSDGYQVGGFPLGWAEWNGYFRDKFRSFWKGDEGVLPQFINAFTGSSNIYGADPRQAYASINFVTCHDGFTLHDLVSYNDKHNDANKEDNRDGESHNASWNSGAEGPTDNADILSLRERQMRNFLASMILSIGVPMIHGGDEMAHTKQSNNNTYCQDNELSWYNWEELEEHQGLYDFTARIIQLKQSNAIFQRTGYFEGSVKTPQKTVIHDIRWFNPDGQETQSEHWQNPTHKTIGCLINNKAALITDDTPEEFLENTRQRSIIFLFNTHYEPVTYHFPDFIGEIGKKNWKRFVDTADINVKEQPMLGKEYVMQPYSLAIFEA